jgi:hypothetical protein
MSNEIPSHDILGYPINLEYENRTILSKIHNAIYLALKF